MTETTKTVFETYQVRKTKKQKTAFIDYVNTVAAEQGYDCHVEKGYLGARNIVVGDPEKAKVVYTAHYDTCARLPFPNFISPKNLGVYLLYQLLLVFLLVLPSAIAVAVATAICILARAPAEVAAAIVMPLWYGIFVLDLVMMVAGPANKHTANDNTSGTTTLLDLMVAMPQELRGEVAFIFFDLEEPGLWGSMGYAAKHGKAMKRTWVINFDCVSDGETMLFAVSKGAKTLAPALAEAFPPCEGMAVDIATKGVFYPSDQVNFPRGVGVAAMKKSKVGKVLYLDRVHTRKDTVYREENIAFLVDGAIRLTRAVSDTH